MTITKIAQNLNSKKVPCNFEFAGPFKIWWDHSNLVIGSFESVVDHCNILIIRFRCGSTLLLQQIMPSEVLPTPPRASSAADTVEVTAADPEMQRERGGNNNAHDDEQEELDNDNDNMEHTFDEELDLYNRVRENRAHLDPGYSLLDDYDDVPDDEPHGTWTPVDPTIVNLSVNGAKHQQWEDCKSELEQVRAQVRKVLRTENPTRRDILNYFYGGNSLLCALFRRRFGWSTRTFLLFMATNCRLAANKSSASKLYNNEFPTPEIDHLLEKEEYYKCWKDIAEEGIPTSSSMGATSQTLFWEEVEETVNKMLRELFIVGRSGKMINLIDDDKFHFESHPRFNACFNVKIMKHVRDNRWGMVIDALCTPSLHFPINIRTHRKKSTQLDNTKMQLFGSAYGNDPSIAPDLSNIHLGMDRGYSFENQHTETLIPSKMDITCSAARSKALPFNYGQTPSQNDKRIYLDEGGISSLRMMKKTCQGRRIVAGAWNTGTTVVLFQSTVFRTYKIDFVTTTERYGKMWNNDRQQLRAIGYAMEESISTLKAEQKQIHNAYLQLFFNLPITQVTVTSNLSEWHLARRLSATSKQTYAMVAVLRKHFMDLENDNIRRVLKFMYKNYSLEDRRAEKDRQDQAAEEATNNNGEEPIEFESHRSIEELVRADAGDDLTIEETAKRDLHLFHSGAFDQDEHFVDQVLNDGDKNADYYSEFLRQLRCSLRPSTNTDTLKKHCIKYVETSEEKRHLVLRSKDDLRIIYRRKHGRPHAESWSNKVLIEKILEDADDTTGVEDGCFEQDFMNTIVGNMSLTRLSNEAQENCAIGHQMEPIFAKEFMALSKSGSIPYDVEDISTVGLVQKNSSIYQKTSVDRIVGIRDANGNRKLHLLELKARVKQDRVQKEEDRIDLLRCNNFMSQHSIFAEMDADNRYSHLGIHDPSERLQVLHHASVYSQDCCFHAVGDTKHLLSIVKMNFSPELLGAYEAMLEFVYNSGLNIFYRNDRDGSGKIVADDIEMKRIETAVAKHGRTFGAGEGMSRFDFNYRLWRKALEEENLPLPPVKQILPLPLAHWNINKPCGDMTTQMLWEQNYHPPKNANNVQSALVKRLGHQYPSYAVHRLFQLFATEKPLDSFPSILSFRDRVRKNLAFWMSFCHMESTLSSMAVEYDPERPLPPPGAAGAGNNQVALPHNIPSWPDVFPTTGSSPKRQRRTYYGNADNSHKYYYQRRHRCLGIVHIASDANGNPVKHKTCAQCNRKDASWYCGTCHLYFHNMTHNVKIRGNQPIPVMAASTGQINADGTPEIMYARMTCADLWHYNARQQFYSEASTRQPIPSHSIVSFDQNVHNRACNISFADPTDVTIVSGGNTTDGDDSSTPTP